jgi:hypothetical protein
MPSARKRRESIGDHDVEWDKPSLERQISHILSHMWYLELKIINDMNVKWWLFGGGNELNRGEWKERVKERWTLSKIFIHYQKSLYFKYFMKVE